MYRRSPLCVFRRSSSSGLGTRGLETVNEWCVWVKGRQFMSRATRIHEYANARMRECGGGTLCLVRRSIRAEVGLSPHDIPRSPRHIPYIHPAHSEHPAHSPGRSDVILILRPFRPFPGGARNFGDSLGSCSAPVGGK
jgi:hypothetical protein